MPLSSADVIALMQSGKADILAGLLNQLGSCAPASPPKQMIESIRSYITEIRGLTQDDYRVISDNVQDFLLNKERGMEQFYEVIRQGTIK